jgi:hypothetical protein
MLVSLQCPEQQNKPNNSVKENRGRERGYKTTKTKHVRNTLIHAFQIRSHKRQDDQHLENGWR